jgi:hypothetical protein
LSEKTVFKTVLTQELENVRKDVSKQQDEINNLKKNLSSPGDIPIGFLYTQLPNQTSPVELWPNMKWTEVTQQYFGLFFRAEGGHSSH